MMSSSHGPGWILVLADREDVAAVAGRHSAAADHVLRHPSGRPWALAARGAAVVTIVQAGPDREVMLLGPGSVAPPALESALAAARAPADLEPALGELPGVFHVAVRIGRAVRLRGTASDVRRVYHRTTGCGVGATRADLLGARTRGGAPDLDDEGLALRLLEQLPHPLGSSTVWRAVRAVPAGSALDVHADGRTSLRRWWSAPHPVQRAADVLPELQVALRDAVGLHVVAGGRVGSELSGGLDSAVVTALAARGAREAGTAAPVVVTARSRDLLDDDWPHARAAADQIERIEHRVVESTDLPLVYADLLGTTAPASPLDEPSTAVAHAARVRAVVAASARAGARTHLTGHGGDHLFLGHPTLSVDLIRTGPRAAFHRLRAYRGLFGWPARRALRQLATPLPYHRWLRHRAVSERVPDGREPLLDWGLPAALRPWLTPAARELVRGAIGRAAIHAEPLAPTRGRHAELEGLHDGGQLVRAITDLTAAAGPLVAAPYLDDRVIESVLAVRIDERLQPWSYKPLLRAVAADDLPRALAGREAKGVGTLDDALGLADGVAVLRQVFGESRLGDRGLIDAAAVCRLLDSPHAPHLQDGALLSTLAVEMWLRSREDVVPDDRMARTATTAAEDRIR